MGRINTFEIISYKPFQNQVLDFSSKAENGLYVIFGENTFGKTSLLEAFEWLLYGRQPRESSVSNETRVALDFELPNGSTIHLERFGDGKTVSRKIDDVSGSEEKPFDILASTILPEVVSKWFLFKGEFLEHLFDDYNEAELKDNIFRLSRLGRLKLAKKALESEVLNTLRKKRKKHGKVSKKLEELTGKLERTSQAINNVEEEITRLDRKVSHLKSQKSELENEISESQNNELVERQVELGTEINEKKKWLTNLKEKLSDMFKEDAIAIFATDIVSKFLGWATRKEKQGDLPPPIHKKIIQTSIDEKQCKLCDRTLDADDISGLENKLKKSKDSAKFSALYQMYLRHQDIESNASQSRENILNQVNEILEEKRNIRRLQQNHETVLSQLELTQDEAAESRRRSQRLNQLSKDLNKTLEELARIKQRLKDLRQEKKTLNVAYEKEQAKLGDPNILDEQIARANTILATLTDVLDEASEKLRSQLEESMQDNLSAFFERLEDTKDYSVNFDESFRLSLIDKESGKERSFGSLSTGEHKSLSLSFLVSLSEFYGFEFPLVIDAPFSDLGTPLRKQLLELVLAAASKYQVILISLPNLEDEIKSTLHKESLKTFTFDERGVINVDSR